VADGGFADTGVPMSIGLFLGYIFAYSVAAIVVAGGCVAIGASKVLEWCIE